MSSFTAESEFASTKMVNNVMHLTAKLRENEGQPVSMILKM